MVSEWVSLCSKLADIEAYILTLKFLFNYIAKQSVLEMAPATSTVQKH